MQAVQWSGSTPLSLLWRHWTVALGALHGDQFWTEFTLEDAIEFYTFAALEALPWV
jgi:hypothetical protein